MNSGFYSSAEARRVARVAWLAIAAQLLFVAAWVVARESRLSAPASESAA
jgi:hypothetical protein